MAKIGLLVTAGPFQFQKWETAVNLADAALDKGHEVRVFFYLDGIYNPNRHQSFPDLPVLPKDRFAKLVERGAQLIACGICVRARGQKGEDYIDGVPVGGLPDFAEMLGEVDRLVTL
ncbi:MAG: DsrE/DsrF/TusD sulfur relay family protein [Candidatus Methylomirabilales bacterium]